MTVTEWIDEEGLVSVNDAAKLTGLSRATIYRLMDHGELAWAKLGGARRIPRKSIREYVQRCMHDGKED
jgi:excisionase family DNA binding protein